MASETLADTKPVDEAQTLVKQVAEDESTKEDSKDGVTQPDEEIKKEDEDTEALGKGKGRKKAKRGGKRSVKKEEGLKKEGSESGQKRRMSSGSSLKEPVTPIVRPARERKVVERYSVPSPKNSASKGLTIEKGRGTQLKDIPNVAFKLSKRKGDNNLQTLHTILFGKKSKAFNLKRNIGLFSGFVWTENEEKQRAKVKEKIDKCVKEKLFDFCDVLNIPDSKTSVKKEDLSVKLLEFLEAPHTTTDVLLADKVQKSKKRRRNSKSTNTNSGEAASETPAKKRKRTPQTGEKKKRSTKVTKEVAVDDEDVAPSESKDDSPEDNDNDNDTVSKENDQEKSEEDHKEDETKEKKKGKKALSKKNVKADVEAKSPVKSMPVKKGKSEKPVQSLEKSTKKSSGSTSKKRAGDATPESGSKSKASSAKKQKVEKEDLKKGGSVSDKEKKTKSEKDQSKSTPEVSEKEKGKRKTGKKAKKEPTNEEMKKVVADILKEVDFNTATLSDILRQLGTHFGVDLMHRKAEVKSIITDVINSMTDEEDEEGEEEENADAGDVEKDGDDEEDGDDDN